MAVASAGKGLETWNKDQIVPSIYNHFINKVLLQKINHKLAINANLNLAKNRKDLEP